MPGTSAQLRCVIYAEKVFFVGETQPLANLNKVFGITEPICSMYDIFTYIWPKFMVNVGLLRRASGYFSNRTNKV